jgi:uncharacterized protein (TIGR00369 family)
MTPDLSPHASRFAPLAEPARQVWSGFGSWGRTYFPSLVGITVEELRTDYARMRLPFRDELEQPGGPVHGGAIATLIDTVVVPAVGSAYPAVPLMLTLSLSINYLAAVMGTDAVAEGWVTRRGRSIVFSQVEVRDAARGELAATASLVYKVREAA